MERPLVTACMFCLVCATHAHCSSTHGSGSALETSQAALPARLPLVWGRRRKRSEDFVREVFEEFGDGETLNRDGFEKLLESLASDPSASVTDEHRVGNRHPNHTQTLQNRHCTSVEAVIGEAEIVTREGYIGLCPKLVHYLVRKKPCRVEHHHHHQSSNEAETPTTTTQAAVWVYAGVSVVMISLCGLLAVAVIPLMHHGIYHSLLQFLVALAVGTLCGDALLHLLPHAMMSLHSHDGETSEQNEIDNHNTNLWRGLVAASTIVFFYFTEKCLSMVAEWRKKRQRKNTMNTRVRVMRDDTGKSESGSRVGEKLCKHKYSSYPYCYGEIASNPDSHHNNHTNTGEEVNSVAKDENGATNPMITNHKLEVDIEINKEDVPTSEKQLLEGREGQSEYTTVILREHETRHHGHAHTHGHVHSAPRSLGSVAWMVVLGDGLHNFTDGLAIGAAFAANIGGGVSTAVAVFCHELPHELGDFAVLLKAGMSAKQAVFYNLLSSVLCLFGMCLGVILGHSQQTIFWVFSAAAGMFLYIALVDMIPELTSSHSTEGGSGTQGFLQLAGLITGISIMLLIALYEHDLKNAFKDSF